MAMHMSVGAPGCCAVLEVFNSRTKFGSYRFHGNALRSVGVHYSRIHSIEYTPVERDEARRRYGLSERSLRCPSKDTLRRKSAAQSGYRGLQIWPGNRSSSRRSRQLKRTQSAVDFVSIDASVVTDRLLSVISVLAKSGGSADAAHTSAEMHNDKHFDYRRVGSCLISSVLDDPHLTDYSSNYS